MGALPLADPVAAAERLAAYEEAGADRFVHSERYADADDFHRRLDALASLKG